MHPQAKSDIHTINQHHSLNYVVIYSEWILNKGEEIKTMNQKENLFFKVVQDTIIISINVIKGNFNAFLFNYSIEKSLGCIWLYVVVSFSIWNLRSEALKYLKR